MSEMIEMACIGCFEPFLSPCPSVRRCPECEITVTEMLQGERLQETQRIDDAVRPSGLTHSPTCPDCDKGITGPGIIYQDATHGARIYCTDCGDARIVNREIDRHESVLSEYRVRGSDLLRAMNEFDEQHGLEDKEEELFHRLDTCLALYSEALFKLMRERKVKA